MRRGARVVVLVALAMTGLAAGMFLAGVKPSHAASRAQATTRVAITAKEFKFTLSKRSAPIGTVIFTITNRGKISHDFEVAGKKTPRLSPGQSATLRVTFSKKGRYAYRSTLAGQATAGMKGIFSVVAAVAPTPTPTPTTTTTTPYTPPTGPVGTANTTVTVTLTNDVRGIITLSEGTFPSGMVTFVITSQCHDQCSFHLDGVKAGALLNRNQTETWTVALPKGTYLYHCDMNPSFMKGLFTVTP